MITHLGVKVDLLIALNYTTSTIAYRLSLSEASRAGIRQDIPYPSSTIRPRRIRELMGMALGEGKVLWHDISLP